MKYLWFLLWACIPCITMAQRSSQMEQYLLASLRGKQVENPGKNFSAERLLAKRAAVWRAWCRANQQFDEPGLPDLAELKTAPQGRWEIPAALEPDAAMPFYFGYKGACPKEGYPCFIYLHGSGAKTQEWANGLILSQRFADDPSLYFVPQIPNEGSWYRWWQQGKQFVWERLLRQLLLRNDVNPNRLYVFGISEGGYGSQRLASYYADYWAGAGPMAGGEPLKNAPAENMCNTPFILRTGAEDRGFYRNILTGYVAEAFDSLRREYPDMFCHRVELIPGRGHHIDYSPTTPWMSQYQRNPYPKHFIWEDFEMDGRHRSAYGCLAIQQRPHPTLRTRYDVKIKENEVDITVQDVTYHTLERDSIYGIEMKFGRSYSLAESGRFTLFLNEYMVDLEQPVIVRVNGKEVYNDKLQLSTRHLLHSVQAFYDSRRLFPAAVEIQL